MGGEGPVLMTPQNKTKRVFALPTRQRFAYAIGVMIRARFNSTQLVRSFGIVDREYRGNKNFSFCVISDLLTSCLNMLGRKKKTSTVYKLKNFYSYLNFYLYCYFLL